MANTLLATILVLLINVFLFHEAAARPPSRNLGPRGPNFNGSKYSMPTRELYLLEQNRARDTVWVVRLKWHRTLAGAAYPVVTHQKTKMDCRLANLTGSIYGKNQYWEVHGKMERKMQTAVHFWVAEKKYYNYANNSYTNNHDCQGYTQVVWRKSIEVGCARAFCAREKSSLTICFYNPPGNVVGEKPY